MVFAELLQAVLPTLMLVLIYAIRLDAFRTKLLLQHTMSELNKHSQSELKIKNERLKGIR